MNFTIVLQNVNGFSQNKCEFKEKMQESHEQTAKSKTWERKIFIDRRQKRVYKAVHKAKASLGEIPEASLFLRNEKPAPQDRTIEKHGGGPQHMKRGKREERVL